MTLNINLMEAAIQFAAGTEANWNTFALPIPENVVIITTDTLKFKRGDGVHTYSELPVGATIVNIAAGNNNLINVLAALTPSTEGMIIIIDNEVYKASSTLLTDVLARLTAILNKDTVQTANMDTVVSQSNLADTRITNADNNKLAIITSHKMSPGPVGDNLVSAVAPSLIHVKKIAAYSDLACTIPVTSITGGSVYYVKVQPTHDIADGDSIVTTLISDNVNIIITNLGRGVFQVNVGTIDASVTVIFTSLSTMSSDSITRHLTITANRQPNMLVSIYGGGASADQFYGVVTDQAGNIICAGRTFSEGPGNPTNCNGLVVKFDTNMNILTRKSYGVATSTDDQFQAIAIDSAGYIFCAGSSVGGGVWDSVVVKFDSNLTVVAKGGYTTITNQFLGIAVDPSGFVITCGTVANGAAYDGFVCRFNNSLVLLAAKAYGSAATDDRFVSVDTDSAGNIVCCGFTSTNMTGVSSYHDALVVKFDTNLVILAQKKYAGAAEDIFNDVVVDSGNNIICVGWTASEGAGSYDALVVKFDTNLNVLVKKIYGGASADQFYGVVTDQAGNIICAGYTFSEGAGSPTFSDALVVKFDTNLTILARKIYGGANYDYSFSVCVDVAGNLICVGQTSSIGMGSSDALVIKLPAAMPVGTFTGVKYTGMALADSTLNLANSALTLSALAFVTSAPALAASPLAQTAAASVLTQMIDSM